MHHNSGVALSCHPVDQAMATAHPPQALAAAPVEIDLDHQGACYALDCWLRTQEVNGEPGDGPPEFFEYLEQIEIDFPESVVPPPSRVGTSRTTSRTVQKDRKEGARAKPTRCGNQAHRSFSSHSQKETLGTTGPCVVAPHVYRISSVPQ